MVPPAQATTLGGGIHQRGHLTADNSPQNHQGDSLGAIPLWSSTLVSSPHSITECPSEVVTGPSIMEEIEEILSNPVFEMPGESSMHNPPRRPPFTDLPDPMAS